MIRKYRRTTSVREHAFQVLPKEPTGPQELYLWLQYYKNLNSTAVKIPSRMKETLNYIQKRPFLAYNGFIVGCWSSIVQTSQFENKKNRETKGKIQVLSFRTISYIPVRGRCRETQSQL